MAKLTLAGKALFVAVAMGLITFGLQKAGVLDKYLHRASAPSSSSSSTPPDSVAPTGDQITKGNLIINGSTALLPVVNALKDTYQKKFPGIKFTVGYQGTSVGIESLIGGACDIAAASRKAKDKETKMATTKSVNLVPHTIAMDAIAIIVNKANPIYGLSQAELARIYTGGLTNWKQVRGLDIPITAYAREEKAGLHALFKEIALKDQPYGANVKYAYDTTSMIQHIIHDKGAIGLATITQSTNQSKVKIIGISANDGEPAINPQISLNQINSRVISTGAYPLTRPMLLYTTDKASPLIQQFVDFAKSSEGQQVIQSKDFVPVMELD